MRMSDWSSDVGTSDLFRAKHQGGCPDAGNHCLCSCRVSLLGQRQAGLLHKRVPALVLLDRVAIYRGPVACHNLKTQISKLGLDLVIAQGFLKGNSQAVCRSEERR